MTPSEQAEFVARKKWSEMTSFEQQRIVKLFTVMETHTVYKILDTLGRHDGDEKL